MPDTKISALPAASAADLTNELPINEAGTTKKLTIAQVRDIVQSSLLRFTAPPTTGWSFVNQDGATLTYVDGSVFLDYPATATDLISLCPVVRAAPSTPYSVIAALIPNHTRIDRSASEQHTGIVMRESATGKEEMFILAENPFDSSSDAILFYQKWTTSNSWSTGSPDGHGTLVRHSSRPPLLWLAMRDDGTNLSFYMSSDGAVFRQVATKSRTSFLTSGPDQVGFMVGDAFAPSGSAAGARLVSWEIQSGAPARTW